MGGSIYDLVPELQKPARALLDAAGAARLQPRITSTFRTRSEQGRLYRRFLAGDAIHFELPGASERAKSLGRGAIDVAPTQSISQWLLQEYNAIPWWISTLLPAATTMQSATSPKTEAWLRSLIQKYGL